MERFAIFCWKQENKVLFHVINIYSVVRLHEKRSYKYLYKNDISSWLVQHIYKFMSNALMQCRRISSFNKIISIPQLNFKFLSMKFFKNEIDRSECLKNQKMKSASFLNALPTLRWYLQKARFFDQSVFTISRMFFFRGGSIKNSFPILLTKGVFKTIGLADISLHSSWMRSCSLSFQNRKMVERFREKQNYFCSIWFWLRASLNSSFTLEE